MQGLMRAWWCLGALWLVACGGTSSDGGSSCGNVTACGGDVVGKWQITSSCLTVDTSGMASSSCPGAKATATDWKVSGSATFNSDKTFAVDSTVTGSVVVTTPASCLMRQGVTVTCEQVQQSLQTSLSEPDAAYSSATCGGAVGGGCSCKLVLKPMASNSTGTYSVADGVLTQQQANGTVGTSDYCVKGNTLTTSPHDDGGMADMTNVTGSIVLTK